MDQERDQKTLKIIFFRSSSGMVSTFEKFYSYFHEAGGARMELNN